MKKFTLNGTTRAAVLTAQLLVLLLLPPLPPCAMAQAPRASTPSPTTQADQTDLSLTVYNSDLALVRDVREITMPAGVSQLKFMDVASSVNPATVHFRSLDDPARLNVLEQNYEYDLLDPQTLLSKYVGRELTVNWGNAQVRATLLADNNGLVWKIGNQIVTGFNPGTMTFPELPDNLYDHPTLLWMLDNRGPQRQKVEASYLASKLSWSADYVMTVNRDETAADLDGWITLVNNSGAAFKNVQLQFVAGQLNRVRRDMEFDSLKAMNQAVTVAGAAAPMQQEAFSEYHLYTLGRRTSVKNNESKQLSLLNATGIPLVKTYEVNGQVYYYRGTIRAGAPLKDPVQVYYKFRNDEKSKLGMALPAGTIRVYQNDSRGNSLFAGEDHIDHTPKDEEINLHVGDAFDVVAERKQTDYKSISSQVHEMEYEITLRNHKDMPITVEVNEPIGGDWEILSSTYDYTKTAAFAAQFKVPIAKGGTSVLRFRVRVHW